MANRPDLEGLILSVLEEQPAHGYEITARIQSRSSDALRLGESQLYPLLHRLESSGAVTASWENQTGRPARKTYSLTPEGSAMLATKRAEWQNFVTSIGPILERLEAKNAV